jgi:hypothetical protein
VHQARRAVQRALLGRSGIRAVTLAEVNLNDGQRMLAFNDFLVGCRTHASARYTLRDGDRAEPQSSSGVLISTGAGSTGWLSSVGNMIAGLTRAMDRPIAFQTRWGWEDRKLMWVVREPFLSKHSSAGLIAGVIKQNQELVIESLMPTNGAVFSDGIESDFLQFNSGTIARVTVSDQHARLVVD